MSLRAQLMSAIQQQGEELSVPFRCIYSGSISKRTSGTNEWKVRYCVIVYGIFAYFRKQEKAEKFINALPIYNMQQMNDQSKLNLQRSLHIESFRHVLKHRYPPRGYIKLLNRNGTPVSSVATNLLQIVSKETENIENINDINNINNETEFKLSIIHKNRTFDLKCDTKELLAYWLNAFQNLGINVASFNDQIQINDTATTVINNQSSISPNDQSISFPVNSDGSQSLPNAENGTYKNETTIQDKENISFQSNTQSPTQYNIHNPNLKQTIIIDETEISDTKQNKQDSDSVMISKSDFDKININNENDKNDNNDIIMKDNDSSNLSSILKLDDSEMERKEISKIEEKDKQLAREQEELLKLLSQDNNKIMQGFEHLQEFIKRTDSTKSLNISENENENENENEFDSDNSDDSDISIKNVNPHQTLPSQATTTTIVPQDRA